MITIAKRPNMGQPHEDEWGYRVHLSAEKDWSGSAPTEEEAWERAKALRDRELWS